MAGGQWQSSGDVEVAAGQALVRFGPETPKGLRTSLLSARAMSILMEFPDGWTLVKLPPGLAVAAGLDQLRGLAGALAVQPNFVYRLNRTPSDPQVLNQWHLGKINAFAGWEYEVGSSSRVTIAILDAGIDSAHPDFSGKLVTGHQFCDPNGGSACAGEAGDTPVVACNHGTRVAGLAAAAANNGNGGAGVSWGAQLLSMRLFDTNDCVSDCSNNGGNDCATTETTIRQAIEFLRSRHNTGTYGKIVANMSLGASCGCGTGCVDSDPMMQTTINNAIGDGLLLVAAAGNSGATANPEVNSPAICNNVMPVGATDENDNIASFSSRGTAMAERGVVAPGVNVLTTDLNGGMTSAAKGTSFSAPIVAGLAALIWSAQPGEDQEYVRNTIRNSAQGVGVSSLGLASVGPQGNTSGAGRINAYRAMRLAVKGTLSDFEGDKKAIAFPNPFRVGTHGTATITVPVDLQGKNPNVKIYAIDGQLVRDLGGNTTWNGRNDSGRQVATGTYIFRVKTDAGLQTGRIAVIR